MGLLPFHDLEESVRASIQRIHGSPFLPDSFAAGGYVYDVSAGRLREVAVPSAVGADG